MTRTSYFKLWLLCQWWGPGPTGLGPALVPRPHRLWVGSTCSTRADRMQIKSLSVYRESGTQAAPTRIFIHRHKPFHLNPLGVSTKLSAQLPCLGERTSLRRGARVNWFRVCRGVRPSANSGAIICYYSILVPIIRIITYYFILFFLLFQLFHLHISDYYFLLSQTLDLGYYFYYFNSIISIIFIGIYYTHYCY